MEEEPKEIIVPPSPSTTIRNSPLGTSLNYISSIEYNDLIHIMG